MPDFCSAVVVDFYPRPPRGGRHPDLNPFLPLKKISIHALREEGDDALVAFDDFAV